MADRVRIMTHFERTLFTPGVPLDADPDKRAEQINALARTECKESDRDL